MCDPCDIWEAEHIFVSISTDRVRQIGILPDVSALGVHRFKGIYTASAVVKVNTSRHRDTAHTFSGVKVKVYFESENLTTALHETTSSQLQMTIQTTLICFTFKYKHHVV